MILQEVSDGLEVVTLNRPDKANALTAEMLENLIQIFEEKSSRVTILTGAGHVFCAGADLDAAKVGLAVSPLWERLSKAVADSPALTIAALNGSLAGGAFGMALACDLRVAVPTAKFFYPVMKLGFLPQPSDPMRLAQLAGPSTAKRILLAGEKLTAQDALRTGLIDHIVEPNALMEMAQALSTDAIAANGEHVAAIKHLTRL